MTKRIILISVAFAALAAAPLFAVSAELIPAMVELDKAYIPALGLSGQADQQEKAKIAFAAFEKTWANFDSRFASKPGFDAEWKEDIEKVNRAVAKAKVELIDKSNGPAAHEALEAVRMTLLESRTRLKVPYFIDALTLFHNSMEDLLNNKPTKKLAEWSAAEKMGTTADLDMALARWKKVKAEESLISDAALSEKAAAVYKTQWQTIESIMQGARTALASGDEKVFSEKLGQLKPNFIKTFFLFGDFPK